MTQALVESLEAFMDGYIDRAGYGLLRCEQLYRNPRWKRWGWRLGWEAANLLTSTPLRTHRGRR